MSRRANVRCWLRLLRTDLVRDAAAEALASPEVAAAPEFAAMLADCVDFAPRYLQHDLTFSWGCCQEAYVTDPDAAQAAMEAFRVCLRERGQVDPEEEWVLEVEGQGLEYD